MSVGKPELSGPNQDPQIIIDLHEKAAMVKKQLLAKNIYRKGVFDKLVGIANDVDNISAQTRLSFEEVVQLADIEDPYQTLIDSMRYWDKILSPHEVPSEKQLIDSLRKNFQLEVKEAAEIVVPPDQLEPKAGDGESNHEDGDDFNRVGMVLETLLHNSLGDEKIFVDDLEVSVGKTSKFGFRKRPYWIINLKKFKIAIFVNNQYGNRTFVLKYMDNTDLEGFSAMTKEQLKALSNKVGMIISHFFFENEIQFKAKLMASVQAAFEGRALQNLYASYEEARAVAQNLGIKTSDEYQKRYREDSGLPSNPDKKYKGEWVSWNVFLNTGKSNFDRAKETYLKMDEAKEAVRALGIRSIKEYRERRAEDGQLPGFPENKYRNEWVSWSDFLGEGQPTLYRSKELYQTIEDAKKAAQNLGIETVEDYHKRYKADSRLPGNPSRKYDSEWISWNDFLGTGKSNFDREKELYQTIEDAKEAVQKLGVKTQREYHKLYRQDASLPASPEKKYKDEWISWSDFLGAGKSNYDRAKETYQKISEAKEAVKILSIRTYDDYRKRYKADKRLPANPARKYHDEWVSWNDFLGK